MNTKGGNESTVGGKRASALEANNAFTHPTLNQIFAILPHLGFLAGKAHPWSCTQIS